jgi:ABC-type nitrate/sulfonate/bicarbonate transport system ATPase subunit
LALTAEIKERRGKLNIDLITVDDEHGVMGQCRRLFGGAVLQVQHFLLLMILKVLLKSPNFLLLDETFSHVSADYQPNLGKLISDLCKKFNIAVLLVTHNEEILPHADVVYNASLVEGELKLKARFKEDR